MPEISENPMKINDNHVHNLQLPISRLPNEILSRIFCDLRNAFMRKPLPKSWRCRPSHGVSCLTSWISITYVCHAWRQVALNTSLLWCHLDINKRMLRYWIRELLQRSKQSALSVIVQLPYNEYNFPVAVKSHFGRVHELVLDYHSNSTMYQIFSSQSDFQNLETLHISVPTPFVLDDSRIRAERLRRLSFCSCSVDWNSKFFLGLTHLWVESVPFDQRLRCHDFTLILSEIPSLQILVLARFFRREGILTPGHRTTKVHLQHLQELHVDCDVPEMAQFLPCLVVPHSCKLRIRTGNNYDASHDGFRAIVSWVSNQLGVPASTSDARNYQEYIRTLHVMHDSVQIIVSGYSDVVSHERLPTARALSILTFAVGWNQYPLGSFDMQTFISSLPLSHLTFLYVVADLDVHLSPQFWTATFGSIQTLTTVYLDAETSAFWKALTPADADAIPFPVLSSVIVEDPTQSLDTDLVLHALRVRSERGGANLRLRVVPPVPLMDQLGVLYE